MSRMLRIGASASLIAALVGGCAKSADSAPGSQPNAVASQSQVASSAPTMAKTTPPTAKSAVATSPAVPSTPALWSTQVAGRQYLSMISSANANLKRMDSAISASSLSGLRKACKKQVTIEDHLMRDLTQGLWPAKVQPYIDKLIDNAAARRTLWRSCSNVASIQEWNDLPDMPDPNPGAAQRVRVMLGLPGTN